MQGKSFAHNMNWGRKSNIENDEERLLSTIVVTLNSVPKLMSLLSLYSRGVCIECGRSTIKFVCKKKKEE